MLLPTRDPLRRLLKTGFAISNFPSEQLISCERHPALGPFFSNLLRVAVKLAEVRQPFQADTGATRRIEICPTTDGADECLASCEMPVGACVSLERLTYLSEDDFDQLPSTTGSSYDVLPRSKGSYKGTTRNTGTGTMLLDDDEIELHKGVVVYVPRGVKHKAVGKLIVLTVCIPRGVLHDVHELE